MCTVFSTSIQQPSATREPRESASAKTIAICKQYCKETEAAPDCNLQTVFAATPVPLVRRQNRLLSCYMCVPRVCTPVPQVPVPYLYTCCTNSVTQLSSQERTNAGVRNIYNPHFFIYCSTLPSPSPRAYRWKMASLTKNRNRSLNESYIVPTAMMARFTPGGKPSFFFLVTKDDY